MVGSAGTRQPAESRSQACRRACPAHDAGVHLSPILAEAKRTENPTAVVTLAQVKLVQSAEMPAYTSRTYASREETENGSSLVPTSSLGRVATIHGINDVDGLDLSKRGTSKPTISLVHARRATASGFTRSPCTCPPRCLPGRWLAATPGDAAAADAASLHHRGPSIRWLPRRRR